MADTISGGNQPVGQGGLNIPGAANIISADLDVMAIVRAIWLRKWLIAAIIASAFGASYFYAKQLPATYAASVSIVLSSNRDMVQGGGMFYDQRRVSRFAAAQEGIIIKSDKVLGRVVDSLELDSYPEFNPTLRKPTLVNRVKGLARELAVLVGLAAPKETASNNKISDEMMRRIQLKRVVAGLTVASDTSAWSILRLTYVSSDRDLAAMIVNKVADEYLNEQLEAKFDATERATSWLNDRMDDLRKEVEIAEAAVIAYKSQQAEQLGHSTNLLDDQVTNLNGQLITAQAELAGVQIRKRQLDALVGTGNNDAVADFLNTTAVLSVRQEIATLKRREAELSTNYGDRHPKMISIRAEIADAGRQYEVQIRKEIQAIDNEMNIARAKVDTITDALRKLEGTSNKMSRASIQLRQYQREAQASRMVYENFLERFKETSGKESLNEEGARIISYAKRGAQVGPNISGILGAGALIGIFLGFGIAGLLAFFEVGYRSAPQLEESLGLPVLGQIPALKDADTSSSRSVTLRHAVANPTSALAESVRGLRIAVARSNIDNPPQVLMTTSAVPQEAKSMTSALLAHTNVQYKKSVIVIDADLRRPSVHDSFDVSSDKTVVDVLSGEATLDEAIVRSPITDVDVLVGKDIAANANAVIASAAFGELIGELRNRYDVVIIDVPPVLAVSDALLAASHVDAVLFAVHWASTPVDAVKTGIKTLKDAGVEVAGTVLTRVDFKKQSRYAYGYGDYGYYYGHYGEYGSATKDG